MALVQGRSTKKTLGHKRLVQVGPEWVQLSLILSCFVAHYKYGKLGHDSRRRLETPNVIFLHPNDPTNTLVDSPSTIRQQPKGKLVYLEIWNPLPRVPFP
ncbi:hypothetical protein RJT34_24466 [Clitoria ternatea]|uniref:Uncharacterized protein n=1 Tax=Clitoria ternatea TaxID=43366 RepID=A0AAN9II15_CLITE